MGISEIITLLTLIIALLAIINEKHRGYLILKFSRFDFLILGILFVCINYFAFYGKFYELGWYLPSLYFNYEWLPRAETYSYFLSLATLSFIAWKVWFSFFPLYKREKVVAFYLKQIENSETQFLFDLIERYHKMDIINHLGREQKKKEDDNSRLPPGLRKTPVNEKIKSKIKGIYAHICPDSGSNKDIYAGLILTRILVNPVLIQNGSSYRPYLYADIIRKLNANIRKYSTKYMVYQFLKNLVENKSFWLKIELEKAGNFDSGQNESFISENRILGAFFDDLSVANHYQIWLPFYDQAKEELNEEREKGINSKLFYEALSDGGLWWEFKTHYFIEFMNYLFNENVVRNYSGGHFHIHIHAVIIKEIMETLNRYNNGSKKNTYYQIIVCIILDNHLNWLIRSHEKSTNKRYLNIIRSLGRCLDEIFKFHTYLQNDPTIRECLKSKINILIGQYLDMEDNNNSEEIMQGIEKLFTNKGHIPMSNHDEFVSLLKEVWREFDQVPYIAGLPRQANHEEFDRFKENVLRPLGIE